MNLDAKIKAAQRCLEREYRGDLDPAILDGVIADIRREHHAEFGNQIRAAAHRILAVVRRWALRVRHPGVRLRPH
jgi:hypothetical protein